MRKILLSVIVFSSLIISCEQAVYTGPPDEPKPQNGKVFVDSNPRGALIYLDGWNMGLKTPATLNGLTYGGHSITLKLNLYLDGKIGLSVSGNYSNSIYYDFVNDPRNLGSLYCSSNPNGSDIYMNDTLTMKKTPFTFNNLKPGSYKIKYTHLDYRADSAVAVVKASTEEYVSLTLEDTSKIVNYLAFNSGLPSNDVNCVVVDHLNHIWVGTGRGLAKFDGKKWRNFDMKNSPLNADFVTHLTVEKNNNILVGTTSGLFLFDGNIWLNYSSSINNNYVNDIAVDSLDNYWIGTLNGLFKFSGGSWTEYNTSNSKIAENNVTCLTVDSKNRVWIGSAYNGLSVLDGNSWYYFNKSNLNVKVSTNQVAALSTGYDGKVWANFWESGLLYFDGTSWNQLLLNGYSIPFVVTFYSTNDKIYMGRKYYGVVVLDSSGKINSLNYLGNGKYIGWVQSIAVDAQGNLWFATPGTGLFKVKKGNFLN